MLLGWKLLIRYLEGNEEIIIKIYNWINNGNDRYIYKYGFR